MMKGTKEFYEVMTQFEKEIKKLPFYGHTYTREDRSMFARNAYYCDGIVNQMFIVFLAGYQYHKSVALLEE
jgi:hypothetical protein